MPPPKLKNEVEKGASTFDTEDAYALLYGMSPQGRSREQNQANSRNEAMYFGYFKMLGWPVEQARKTAQMMAQFDDEDRRTGTRPAPDRALTARTARSVLPASDPALSRTLEDEELMRRRDEILRQRQSMAARATPPPPGVDLPYGVPASAITPQPGAMGTDGVSVSQTGNKMYAPFSSIDTNKRPRNSGGRGY